MSKAFTNEDTPTPDDAEALPPRAGTFPITPAGLARLQKELAEIGSSEVGARRARVIAQATMERVREAVKLRYSPTP